MQPNAKQEARSSIGGQITLILVAVPLMALYTLARYQGYWGENDTAVFTNMLVSFKTAGRLIPEGAVYSNGFGYPSLATILVHTTGLEIENLQIFGASLLVVWLVFPAWLAYREFTSSPRVASLATVILFIQPEFLFPILRGTHEKFTRGMMLLCFYLLLRSIHSRDNLSRLAGLIVSFYLVAFALITYNNLMAISFILALGLALIISWSFNKINKSDSQVSAPLNKRLVYVVLSLLVVAFLFTFYAYPPAQEQLRILQSAADRLAALLLQFDFNATNPYNTVSETWISLPVYFMVSLANWLLLGISAIIWLSWTWKWIIAKQRPANQGQLLLWSSYAAFGILGAISIFVDISGAIGSNLQHRIFPSIAMIASPLAAWGIMFWDEGHKTKPVRLAQLLIGFVLGVLAILSIFKATNEPFLSNKWLFYTPGEMQAVSWASTTLPGRSLWTEFDERLSAAANIHSGGDKIGVLIDYDDIDAGTQYFLYSEVIRQRGERLKELFPFEMDNLLLYDNGQAQVYRLRLPVPAQP